MKLKIFFALLLAACSLSVSAEAYLGLSVGAADYNDSLWSVEDGANDVSWKLFGGYQFNRFLGAEAAWVDLGKVSDNGASARTKGLTVSGVGSIPLGASFSMFGKLGAFFWDQDTRFGGSSNNDTGTDITWGYGATARFLDNRLGIRIEWERYESDLEADLVSLGVSYHF
jgi:OOP family OmpA-OmpF porin